MFIVLCVCVLSGCVLFLVLFDGSRCGFLFWVLFFVVSVFCRCACFIFCCGFVCFLLCRFVFLRRFVYFVFLCGECVLLSLCFGFSSLCFGMRGACSGYLLGACSGVLCGRVGVLLEGC